MSQIKKRILFVIVIIIFILMLVKINKEDGFISVVNFISEKPIIVIDPGHGGVDPGKVGVNNELEKDINLAISLKVKDYLEAQDIKVIMTRETDEGLYSENSSNKKREDMQRRVSLINDAEPDVVVSIHQNSFSQENCKGAQVFYYEGSEKGKLLAEYIQQAFILTVDSNNKRKAKSDTSYYVLKKTKKPTVIVECGFLSNYEEAKLLSSEEYQDKVASAIHIGILTYLENNDDEVDEIKETNELHEINETKETNELNEIDEIKVIND